jgi:hypothetical protein
MGFGRRNMYVMKLMMIKEDHISLSTSDSPLPAKQRSGKKLLITTDIIC